MPFSFGAPKTVSGFTVTTTTTTTNSPGFQFGAAGDAKTTKPAINLTFTPSTIAAITTTVSAATTAPPEFSFASTTVAPQFSLGTTTTATTTSLSFSAATTATPSVLSLSSIPSVTTVNTTTAPSFFSLSGLTTSKASTTALPIISTVAATTATSSSVPITTSTTTIAPTPGATPAITYSQLEDLINKWTIYLEDEGKHYLNQGKQINAWDRLLITNGEKILSLNNGIERVKQNQEQLDQELDFVLAQQKELEDLIAPLEKELDTIPVTDLDRHRTYQMADTLDTQLKQMSEDLKEIVEHLNETNRNQEMANPIVQIGRILNVHMNSLQWIDRNTTKITAHLDQIAKMHDMNKRNHENNLQRTYE